MFKVEFLISKCFIRLLFFLLLTSKMYDRPLNDIHVCVVGCSCVSGASVCRIQVCVGYMCVSYASVCRGKVCVGDMKSRGHVRLILESELHL